jgi:hypothetical protein
MQTSFSKGLGKSLYNRLIEYLNNSNILNSQQFGFRNNLATEDAIFFFLQDSAKDGHKHRNWRLHIQ